MYVKYFSPALYLRKTKELFARMRLGLGWSTQVVTKIDGYELIFVVNSYIEYGLRAQQSYVRENVTMYWLRSIVEPGDAVYDVGANVGAYSLYAGRKVDCHGGQIYAFEPAFSNFYPLSRNIYINKLTDTVIPFPFSVGCNTRIDKFYLSSIVEGAALHSVTKPESEGEEFSPEFLQGTYVTTIDDLATNTTLRFPNHVKIDVDGSELDVINGMQFSLRDHRLKSVLIEIDKDLYGSRIEEIIVPFGFSEIMSEKWESKNVHNVLFFRNSH